MDLFGSLLMCVPGPAAGFRELVVAYGEVMDVRIKRVYDPPGDDGLRILVDRLWPRGLSKERVHADRWLKEVAPSAGLRRWFGHDPDRWEEFKKRYGDELEGQPALSLLLDLAKKEKVTLLFSAKDVEHNHARALLEFLLANKHYE